MNGKKVVYCAGWVAVAVASVALAAGAQGPPPPGGFARRALGRGGLMEGTFEFGGLIGGFGGKTVTGKPFQANFTITRTQTLPNNTITNSTSGVVARDADGSTYRDVKLPAIGPLASSGTPPEFIYIRNVTKVMQYLVNVGKKTYEAFAIQPHDQPPQGPDGKGRSNGPDSSGGSVTDTQSTYTDPVTHAVYPVDDRKTTRTIPAGQIGNQFDLVITSERLFSNDLNLVLQETHSDPRFGSSTYQVSGITTTPSVVFTPDPSFQLVQGHRGFGFRGHGGPGGPSAPPPPPPQN